MKLKKRKKAFQELIYAMQLELVLQTIDVEGSLTVSRTRTRG